MAHVHARAQVRWGYAILDEGHKIRNPDSDITLVAKQVRRHTGAHTVPAEGAVHSVLQASRTSVLHCTPVGPACSTAGRGRR